MSEPIVLARTVQTCRSHPSQWDAWSADGQYLYLRYRGGRGTVDAYDNADSDTWTTPPDGAVARFGEGWDQRSYDGDISLEEFCERAGLILAANAEN
ncbi:hypothetical protein [Streptacidiphilus albus]|uniref:hypothetical protein n=1 Tax=Streptacidiphilus albus TaxID=105425 RepID=UPI00054C6A00|nr:hypothetical protein [Streptacidiphilus albus]